MHERSGETVLVGKAPLSVGSPHSQREGLRKEPEEASWQARHPVGDGRPADEVWPLEMLAEVCVCVRAGNQKGKPARS